MPKVNKDRDEILARLEDEGVRIPLWDGVTVDPSASIAPGATILAGTVISGRTVIGAESVVGPNSVLSNAKLGRRCVVKSSYVADSELEDNVEIGPFCQIRPGCLIRAGVHIGDFVEVKNSTVGEKTKIAHLTYVGDTDCGGGVNFGCGVVTVNYNGKTKSRTRIGDGCFIGCNANLIAPVSVGSGAYVAAGTTVTEDVPEDALAIGRSRQEVKPGRARSYRKD